MAFEWKEYLVLAKELSLRADEASARSAISRAYYAAFNTASRHRGARNAVASERGSHKAIWRALRESGNKDWREAGTKGFGLREFRRKADYDEEVRDLAKLVKETIEAAEEILSLLGP